MIGPDAGEDVLSAGTVAVLTMASRDDLETTAAALDDSIVVSGVGGVADGLADAMPPTVPVRAVSEARDEHAPSVAAVVIGVDVGDAADSTAADSADPTEPIETLRRLASTSAFTVAVVRGADGNASRLSAIAEVVDAVVLVSGDHVASTAEEGPVTGSAEGDAVTGSAEGDAVAEIVDAILTFLAMVRDPGFANLDLADARTVLSSGVAAMGTGTAARDAPTDAVATAFDRLPAEVDPATASAVLVDVVVDPHASLTATTDAIAAVRERIAADANVIWGGTVDESVEDELAVRIVVADVRYAPTFGAGDPCPRCGTALSAYAFGTRETLSCDGCGYSGIGVRRG